MNYALENKINARLKGLKRNGIQFISGTVAPADADVATNDIESMDRALDYFVQKGVTNLVMQPKWMGSRCQLYLHYDEPEKDFAVTRNGFIIKHVDLTEVFAEWRTLFGAAALRSNAMQPASVIILDGELLPWTAIGAGLVEREFYGFVKCYEAQNDFLKENGFTDALLKGSQGLYQEYLVDAQTMDKKAIQTKYPMYETFSNMKSLLDLHNSTYDDEAAFDSFKDQLELYASDTRLEFKAFDILSVQFTPNRLEAKPKLHSPWVGSTTMTYGILSLAGSYPRHEEAFLFNPADPVDVEEVKKRFRTLVNMGYEGVMLKPDTQDTDAVHCMKVRNKEYLRIIYGYDYDRPDKLKDLVMRKRTGKKRKLSHSEYKLGRQMLALDKNSVDYDANYDRIAKEILFEIEEESTLDSRL